MKRPEGRLRAPLSVLDWCVASTASNTDYLEWLCQEPEALAIVNESFLDVPIAGDTWGKTQRLTPIALFVRSGLSLERIRFLVEKAGARPTSEALCYAVQRVPAPWQPEDWDMVHYLEEHGARYTTGLDAREHLLAIMHRRRVDFDAYARREALRFVWRYRKLFDWHQLTDNYFLPDILSMACERDRYARQAARVMAGLHKRRPDLMNKDVAALIARHLISLPLVVDERWDPPPHWAKEVATTALGSLRQLGTWLFSHSTTSGPWNNDE